MQAVFRILDVVNRVPRNFSMISCSQWFTQDMHIAGLNAVILLMLFLLYACFSVQGHFINFCYSQNYRNLYVFISSVTRTNVFIFPTFSKFLITRGCS